MKRPLTFALFFSVLVATVLAVETNAPQTFKFTGTVVSSDDQSLSGAVAELSQYNLARTFTADFEVKERVTANSNGVIQAQLPLGQTLVVVKKPGFALSWASLYDVMADVERRFVLTAPTNVSGIVEDELGKPVPNSEVWVAQALMITPTSQNNQSYNWISGKTAHESFSTRTAADGRFRIEGIASNATVRLAARASGKVLKSDGRDNFRPETMDRPGGKEIKLVLEAAGGLEGKVAASEPNATLGAVQLVLLPDGRNVSVMPEPVAANADGTFRISEVPAGKDRVLAQFGTNLPPDWVAETVPASVEAGQSTRDVRLQAVKGGLLEITVLSADQTPVAGASVNAYRETQGSGGHSGADGKVMLRLVAGPYQVSAYKERLRAENISATVESGTTNRVQVQFKPAPKLAGTVRDSAGQPLAGVQLAVFPNWGAISGTPPKTDAAGHFEMPWDPQRYGSDRNFCLVASDKDKGLAIAEDITDDTQSFDLKLQSGWILSGLVQDAAGKALSDAAITIYLWSGNMGSQFGDPPKTGANGRFKAVCLPAGRRYSVQAAVAGYGSVSQQVPEPEGETNLIELPPFELKVADQILAGQVVDQNEKPAAGVSVSIQGEGQPNVQMNTDDQGRFTTKVCEGKVYVYASSQETYANTRAQAGDTNVVLQLHSYSSQVRETSKRVSLVGRGLPDLAPLGLSTNAATAQGPLLLCLFDSEQRPSRRFLRGLAEQYASIQKKNVSVLGLQAAVISEETMQAWRDGNTVPFPVGRVAEKSPATKWVTDIDSLPWLILTDAMHQVVAEGFNLDELDAKIEALPK